MSDRFRPEWVIDFTGMRILVGLYESSGDVELNGLLAFNIGASAPLIIANLTNRAPSGLSGLQVD